MYVVIKAQMMTQVQVHTIHLQTGSIPEQMVGVAGHGARNPAADSQAQG